MASPQPPRSDFEFGAADSPGPVARGISLWLLPEPGVREGLAHAIDTLAGRLGTPRFEPHLTLLGAIERPEAEVLARVRDLAAICPPLELSVLGLDGADDPFRCLFLRLSATPTLQQLREAARAAGALTQLPGPCREPRDQLAGDTLVREELAAARQLAEERLDRGGDGQLRTVAKRLPGRRRRFDATGLDGRRGARGSESEHSQRPRQGQGAAQGRRHRGGGFGRAGRPLTARRPPA